MARVSCQCGTVAFDAQGQPILTAVCYCDDCQEAARIIEEDGDGPPVVDTDGGTTLALYRKDRFTCIDGAEKVVPHRLRPDSTTVRYVASCCNSALNIGFDNGPFWVSVMTDRMAEPKPGIEARIKTAFRTSTLPFADNAPVHRNYPLWMVARLIRTRIAMMFGR